MLSQCVSHLKTTLLFNIIDRGAGELSHYSIFIIIKGLRYCSEKGNF
jgi:hypothetical protein